MMALPSQGSAASGNVLAAHCTAIIRVTGANVPCVAVHVQAVGPTVMTVALHVALPSAKVSRHSFLSAIVTGLATMVQCALTMRSTGHNMLYIMWKQWRLMNNFYIGRPSFITT